MIVVIDNYDSFVHNLARYLCRLGQRTLVVRNDSVNVADVRALRPAAILLSPGPCTPQEAGCSLALVSELWREIPILGVCLGHQAIAAAFGGRIERAPVPMHGRTSRVWHEQRGVFAGVPNPVTVCRYHSLIVDAATLPRPFEPIAHTDDGIVMGIRHRDAPVVGLQFHPEAILTECGYTMLANFLQLAGIELPGTIPTSTDEWVESAPRQDDIPDEPVTF